MNHDKDIRKLLSPIAVGGLSSREKILMRERIEEYMRYKPMRVPSSPVKTPLYAFLFHPFPSIAAALIIFVTAGTVSAAEGALPGDVLYPVKVRVTEEVRATFATTPEAQAAWALERAERRVAEAALLAAEERLSDVVREALDTSVETHTALALAVLETPNQKESAPTSEALRFSEVAPTTLPHDAALDTVSPEAGDDEYDDERAKNNLRTKAALVKKARDRIVRKEPRHSEVVVTAAMAISPAVQNHSRTATPSLAAQIPETPRALSATRPVEERAVPLAYSPVSETVSAHASDSAELQVLAEVFEKRLAVARKALERAQKRLSNERHAALLIIVERAEELARSARESQSIPLFTEALELLNSVPQEVERLLRSEREEAKKYEQAAQAERDDEERTEETPAPPNHDGDERKERRR